MELDFISQYITPATLIFCLGIGYVIKKSLDFIPNKYIPLILGVLGMTINCFVYVNISAELLLGGLISGLASTGFYEAFKNIIERDKKDEN